jgi:hypothetical protein
MVKLRPEIEEIIQKHLAGKPKVEEMSGANISRVLTHLQNKDCAFITAFIDEYSTNQNDKRNSELKKLLQQLHYSWIEIEGHWPDTNTGVVVKEKSLMVLVVDAPNESFENFEALMVHLRDSYDQQAVIIKKASENPKAYYNNGKIERLGALTMQNIEHGFSKIKSHKFRFGPVINEACINKTISMALIAATIFDTRKRIFENFNLKRS